VIDSNAKLHDYLPTLLASPWVAIDTEADSLHAYPEKLCLLQIGTSGGEALVDPLNGADLSPLFAALAGRELLMHGADYDLRLLRKHHKFIPHSIFDTMVAGRLLGQKQFGLGALVLHYLGITLEKGAQKANWARRPLTPRMEVYALHDVEYLKPLVDKLRAELEAKGRIEWHQESCAWMIREAAEEPAPDPDEVWRVKGSSVLGPPGLAVLRELWLWRELEAVHANLPPFFIMNHESLVRLAADAANGHEVSRLLPPRYSPRRREALLEAIRIGVAVPPEEQPQTPRRQHHRLTMAEVRRLRDITRRRDRQATRLGIDPALIASKPVLARLAHDWDGHSGELMNWQKALLLEREDSARVPATSAPPSTGLPEPVPVAED
jgi:ribonuclease D